MTGSTSSGAGTGNAVRIGLVLVFATAFISGLSTFVNGYAVAGTNSAAFVTVRNMVVVVLLVPIAVVAALWRRNSIHLRGKDWGRLAIIGLIGGAIPFLLFFHGLQLAVEEGGSTTASFVYRTLFIFATVFGLVFLGERFRWEVVAIAGALLAGCYFLLAMHTVVLGVGALYVLAATVLWAGEYTLSKRVLADLPSSVVGLGRMGFGAVFLAAYLALTAQWSAVATFTPGQWMWVGISALLLTAFVATWYAGLARVDLSVAAAVLVLGFVFTWLLALIVQHTVVTWVPALGALIIVLGLGALIASPSLRRWLGEDRAVVPQPGPPDT